MRYTLGDYAAALRADGLEVSLCAPTDAVVSGMTYDSRKVTPGALFIAKGAHFREEFLCAAMQAGAVAYVSQTRFDGEYPCILVNDIRRAMAVVSRMFYNDPAAALTTFGITGTKGKSTTSYYLRYILDEYARTRGEAPAGIISTIETFDGVENFESTMTTPESPDLWRHLRNEYESGIVNSVVEVSSQALKYHRVAGLTFSVGCFLNIGLDHISPVEHSNFEDYFASKLKIFDQCRTAVVNADDEHADRMLAYIGGRVPVITVGSHPTDTVRVSDVVRREEGGYSFRVATPVGECDMSLPMPGKFNVQNAVAAAAMAYAVGIPLETVRDALRDARVSGRMVVYRSADGKKTVVIDKAHNVMSFEALYRALDEDFPGVDKISVFGCVGEKSQNRRAELGTLCGTRCVHVVVTEKDTGDEPFENIAEETAAALREVGCAYDVIKDREDALRRAVTLGDGAAVITFTGRGDMTTLKRGQAWVYYPSDTEIVRRVLAEYDNNCTADAATVNKMGE